MRCSCLRRPLFYLHCLDTAFLHFLYTAWRQQAHIKQHFARFACTVSSTLYNWGERVRSFNLQTIQQDIHIAGSIYQVHIHYSYQCIVPKRKYGFSATIILVHKLVQQSKLHIQHVAQCRRLASSMATRLSL